MRIAVIALACLIALPAGASKDEAPRILILVDSSSSMATSWPGQGGDRMGAVRTTLDTLEAVFRGRQTQPEIAIRVFGDQTAPTSPDSCADTRLIRPWTAADDGLGASLDGVRPQGRGSLRAALRGALEDLEEPSPNDLVLIFLDSLNQCDREIEEPFNALTREGQGAEVHVFGFALDVTDQLRLSTFAPYHSVGWPGQLIQGVSVVISRRLSLPLMEETVKLNLVGLERTGFDVSVLELDATWSQEPIRVDLSREKPTMKAGLGTATVVATESDQGRRQHLVRVPSIPERNFDLELFEPPDVVMTAEIVSSGWGQPAVIRTTWNGATDAEMQLVLQENGTPGASWFFSQTVAGASGSETLDLPAAAVELTLQLRRQIGPADGIIAAAILDSPGRNLALEAPEIAEPGGSVAIDWVGESYPGDLVTLVPAGTSPEDLGPFVEAIAGPPRDFFVPFDQCSYEFRYIDGRSFEILDRATLEVKAPSAGLRAAESPGDKKMAVRWWGPAGSLDVITISRKDTEADEYLDWAAPADGSPAHFKTPQAPGEYEVRYLIDGTQIAASLPFVIEPVEVEIVAPKRVRVGERIKVSWTGPNDTDDFLVLVRQGQHLRKQLDFAYVSEGSPTSLAAPNRPGIFEIRYVASKQREVLASVTVKVVK